jgi:hypothetical protein
MLMAFGSSFADLNTVALDQNFDRKALSARCED